MNCFTFFLFIYLHSCSIFWPYSQFGFTSNRFPWTHSATTSSLANPFWTWADLIRFSNESYWIWLNSWSAERPNGGWRPAERHTSSMKIFFPFFSSFFCFSTNNERQWNPFLCATGCRPASLVSIQCWWSVQPGNGNGYGGPLLIIIIVITIIVVITVDIIIPPNSSAPFYGDPRR